MALSHSSRQCLYESVNRTNTFADWNEIDAGLLLSGTLFSSTLKWSDKNLYFWIIALMNINNQFDILVYGCFMVFMGLFIIFLIWFVSCWEIDMENLNFSGNGHFSLYRHIVPWILSRPKFWVPLYVCVRYMSWTNDENMKNRSKTFNSLYFLVQLNSMYFNHGLSRKSKIRFFQDHMDICVLSQLVNITSEFHHTNCAR